MIKNVTYIEIMKIENVKFYYESKSKNKKIIMSMIIKRDTYYTLHVYNYLFTFSYLFIYIVSYLFHIPNLPHVPKKKKKIKPRTSTLHVYTILFKSKHHKDSYTHTSLKYTMETYIIQLVKKAKTFHPHPTFFPSADIHPTLISFFKNNKVQASFRRARERERERATLSQRVYRLGASGKRVPGALSSRYSVEVDERRAAGTLIPSRRSRFPRRRSMR